MPKSLPTLIGQLYRLFLGAVRLSILPLLLLAFPKMVAGDCGGGPAYYGYQFLDPGIAGFDQKLTPHIAGFGELYEEYFKDAATLQQQDNISEWHERYCEQVKKADLEQLIYGRSENRLNQLLRVIRQPESRLADLSPALRTNSFARHLLKHRCTEVVAYLIFAKRCEPLVSRPRNAFATQAPDGNAMRQLIPLGLEQFNNTKSHYIRLRYAFQLLRLAHYAKDYARVLELYDYLMPKVDADPSLIYHWVDGHYAGALLKLGERVKAAYIYARIFEACPSKRESAYRSFSIQTDEEWEQVLLMCNNDHERANLHILRAQNEKALLVPEMKAVYALEPANRGLELLLVREMEKLEIDFLGADFNPQARYNRNFGIPRPGARDRLIELQQFVFEVVEDGLAARPELWTLAAGFLELLSGDYFYARKRFQELLPTLKNDTLQAQVEIFNRVLNVLSLSKLTDSTEQRYYRILLDDELSEQYPDLGKLINDRFRDIYQDQGQFGKAYLMRYGLDALKHNLDINLIAELRTLAQDTNANNYDRRLLLERAGAEAEADLIDMEATYYLQRGQLAAAYRIFQEIPTEKWDNYGNYAPFVPHLNDRVNARLPDTIRLYNKGEMMGRILELTQIADETTDPDQAARNYFAVGLAYYNMSYYGYNWRAADYYRSGVNGNRAAAGQGEDFVFSAYYLSPFGNFENMNMERARYFFERARVRAYNPEIAARATFWAAKAERNEHYAAGRPGGQRTFGYFNILAQYYQDTRYYNRVVEECKTFAWYVGR